MTILEKIIAYKKQEVSELKREVMVEKLVKSPSFNRTPISFKKALTTKNSSGIIAEFKRKSPSKDEINMDASVIDVTNGYINANAAAQSILTDIHFFGGNIMDIMQARSVNDSIPILRKDFIVDAFQIVESKAIGADAILLIASVLSKEEIKKYGQLAEDLGLEVLYEIHNEEELEKLNPTNQIIGVNNRNLKTFEVDLETSIELSSLIPNTCVKVSESGISDPRIVTGLKAYGFKGFLIGENFMKSNNPGQSCKEFINQLD